MGFLESHLGCMTNRQDKTSLSSLKDYSLAIYEDRKLKLREVIPIAASKVYGSTRNFLECNWQNAYQSFKHAERLYKRRN